MGSERAAVALGSNLGDRAAILARARDAIARLPATRLIAASEVEETAPLGPVPQGPYLNQMLLVETALEPCALLDALLAIERAEGRERRERWGPRTLDCDIVLYGERTLREPTLVVPHPELPNRNFWQRELRQLGLDPQGAAGSGERAV
ncbi:MAG TPA: 2-amino-4-hydroxy-6-hydroxymethyldihydropteridine diphosphokinase [Gemmatimonadales bacterium]|nr:2-amino-4-hydroxy-6-hydroxymethyldihydropteridine diphosphokinase [Gemmatimonadales bacterium]